MGNISSFHIDPSKANNCEHNDRTHKPTYLKGTSFECNRSCDDARILYNALLNKAVYNYTKRTNQKPQFNEENLRWSAVVNIKSDTTMQDLEKLSDFLNKKYGMTCEEMETNAVAQICQNADLPFIGIRVLSDNITINDDYAPKSATIAQDFVLLVVEDYIKAIKK